MPRQRKTTTEKREASETEEHMRASEKKDLSCNRMPKDTSRSGALTKSVSTHAEQEAKSAIRHAQTRVFSTIENAVHRHE